MEKAEVLHKVMGAASKGKQTEPQWGPGQVSSSSSFTRSSSKEERTVKRKTNSKLAHTGPLVLGLFR